MKIESLQYPKGEWVPNHPRWPALLMPLAFGGAIEVDRVQTTYARHGWTGSWVWTVFDYHHYHPDAHEVLTVVQGSARLMLGGPQGGEHDVQSGDALILPAGFGHRRLQASTDFLVCGAYPTGQADYTTIRANIPSSEQDQSLIDAVPCPTSDPIFGRNGPLLTFWLKEPKDND